MSGVFVWAKLIHPEIVRIEWFWPLGNSRNIATVTLDYYCDIILNNLLTFLVLQSKAWWYYCDSYCYVRYQCRTCVTFLTKNSTIWCHNSTIWCHNSSIWCHNNTIWHHNSTIWCHNSRTTITGNIKKYWLVIKIFWVTMHC